MDDRNREGKGQGWMRSGPARDEHLSFDDIRRLVVKVQEEQLDDPNFETFSAKEPDTSNELPAALDALSGTVLEDRYQIGEVLGSGGMGAVFEGRHLRLDRPVAIKVLRPRLAVEIEYVERFLREAKAASKVRHRNVVEILDYGETKSGLVYSVMEFLEGRDLQQFLREQPHERLPWSMAYGLLVQIASGLKAAHGKGVIHRDIKPSNCFLTEEDGEPVVKLLDFGIAKLEDAGHGFALTRTTQLMGTPGFIAPEQAQTRQPATPQSDIYALGVVAYRMLVGQMPFLGETTFEVIRKGCFEPVPSLRALVPELPPQVESLVMHMLAKTPEQRPADMGVVRAQLLQLGQTTLGVPSSVVGPTSSDPRWSSVSGDARPSVEKTVRAYAPTAPPASAMGNRPAPPAMAITPQMTPNPDWMHMSRSNEMVQLSDLAVPVGKESSTLFQRVGLGALLALVVGVTVVVGALMTWGPLGRDGGVEAPVEAPAEAPFEAEPVEVESIELEPVGPKGSVDEPVSPTEGAGSGTDADQTEPAADSGQEAGEPEAEPTTPAKKRKPKASTRPPADSVVIKRLERKISSKCATELGVGPVTVKFLVTVSGSVMGVTASGAAGSCARAQVKRAKFRERSSSTPFKLVVK